FADQRGDFIGSELSANGYVHLVATLYRSIDQAVNRMKASKTAGESQIGGCVSCTMQCIIYIIMKRTQLYLDEDIARILSAVSRQQGRTVSELVRECVREKFGEKKSVNKAALARQIAG